MRHGVNMGACNCDRRRYLSIAIPKCRVIRASCAMEVLLTNVGRRVGSAHAPTIARQSSPKAGREPDNVNIDNNYASRYR